MTTNAMKLVADLSPNGRVLAFDNHAITLIYNEIQKMERDSEALILAGFDIISYNDILIVK